MFQRRVVGYGRKVANEDPTQMKIRVEVDFGGQAFADDPLLTMEGVFEQVAEKAMRQSYRLPGCVCTALEEDDIVRDPNGNVIGHIEVICEMSKEKVT